MKMNLISILIIMFCFGSFTLEAKPKKVTKSYSWAEELEQLKRIDMLPSYRTNCVVEQISSYDTTGGNNDGFSGQYSYLRKENGKLVLADLKGPGVINRIWTPTPTADTISFYFDGETLPRLSLRFSDLFSGKVYPFVKPICANEVGGFYCYIPIPYEKSCKVVFSGERIQFHQIQYRNLPQYSVVSYSARAIEEHRSLLNDICMKWSDIAPSVGSYTYGLSSDYKVHREDFTIEPGQEIPFFVKNNGGRIVGFEIDGGVSFDGVNKDILLSAVWDDEPTRAIYAPLADYFGYAYGHGAMRSMLIGKRGDVNYSYLPCPFDKSAQMKLIYKKRDGVKQNPIQVSTITYYNDKARNPQTEGRFYTTWNREVDPPKGAYFKFANLSSRGHYVGTVHLAQGLESGMTLFFEGDDSVRVDGKMRIHGTGSEDAYNGGWYALLDCWDRGVSLPIHGALDYSLPMSRTGAYRFFLTDKLSYERDLYMGIEHGPQGNAYQVDYTSVAYYYSDRCAAVTKEPTEELRTVYMPDKHVFFPQLMDITLGWGVNAVHGRGITLKTEGAGKVRIMLNDVPEGRYKISMTYYEKPTGAKFCLWQRQNRITQWQSTHSDTESIQDRVFMGEIELTRQTNSISIHIGGANGADEFEFENIYLEKIL